MDDVAPGEDDKGGRRTRDFRVRCFLDFWNFELERKGRFRPPGDFEVDWRRLGPWLCAQAGLVVLDAAQQSRIRYDGLHIYLSYDSRGEQDRRLVAWARNTLDPLPGIHVTARERRPRHPPRCPKCRTSIPRCPACGASLAGTREKGIDSAIVTDMIRLAWEDAYDLAVLVSGDADFVPAVEFLGNKERRVVHAAFPPKGGELTRACWASIDLARCLPEVRR